LKHQSTGEGAGSFPSPAENGRESLSYGTHNELSRHLHGDDIITSLTAPLTCLLQVRALTSPSIRCE
jgi:hypothetical protein